ncbi:MAG: DUF2062 domain-containing protein [Methylococcaceae bacterium]|nr:DUF2062 domain-containing protein [Methylococcaceae bacterium]
MPKKILKRYLPDPERIKSIKALDFLGDRLHSPNLWHLNRRSVSWGFAIGLWSMYTPLPAQMVLSAVLAIFFNANLPISVALVWITNPLTWIPLYYLAYKLGAVTLGVSYFDFQEFSQLFAIDTIWHLGAPLLVGCLILMHAGMVLGYVGIQLYWRRMVTHRWTLRKFRDAPVNTLLMISEPHGSYMRMLKDKHERKK